MQHLFYLWLIELNPMQIENNYSLKHLNTFQIDVMGRYYVEPESDQQIAELIASKYLDTSFLILGGGSNILFTKDFDGIIIKINTKGISVISEDNNSVLLKSKAGENWDDLVAFSVENGWGGLENLSGIPGNVGASPIQNIGAYGSELSDHFYALEAMELKSGKITVFKKEDCSFAYRNSIFKNKLKNKYILLSVTFKLDKNPTPNFSYAELKNKFGKAGTASLQEIRNTILDIRNSKLPDPDVTGNAGSFFKNPEISSDKYLSLKKQFPNLVAFKQPGARYKLAAGWMIDQCGWKGKQVGNAGVFRNQALVLVNHGGASGAEIMKLAKSIQQSVLDRFDILLEPEVNIV